MDEFKVDQQTAAVAEMAQAWGIIDAVSGGTKTMRAAGKAYLPQFPQEPDEVYKDRLSTAVLFNAFGRTTEVLAAKPFARPIKTENASAKVEGMFHNVDMLGTELHAFCGQIMQACLRHGLHGVMVDTPKSEGARTLADEKKAGVRPYLTHYPCSSILGWRAQKSADGLFLTQIRLKEQVIEEDGPFGEKMVDQVRVLFPGRWEVWREVKPDGAQKVEWALFDSGVTTIKVIPFVFFYGLRESFGIGRAPMLELAFMNVEHWQSSSDQQNILHVARVPILFAKGFSDSEKVKVGVSSVTKTKNKDGDLKYIEHSGEAVGAGRQSIIDLEDRMRQVGAELLVERQGDVTAAEVNSEDEDNRSTMQKIVEEFEDSLETCLKLMALWVGEKTDPTVEIFKDFNSANLSGKTGDLLMSAVDKGIASKQTAREQLKRADVLPHDLDDAEEDARLEAERQSDIKDQTERAKATAAEKPTPPAA